MNFKQLCIFSHNFKFQNFYCLKKSMDILCPNGAIQSKFLSYYLAYFSRALVIPIYRLLPQFKADEKGFLLK